MRAAKGEGSAFKTDKGYRGYVTVDGKRKYFSAKTKAEASQKRRELLNQRDGGELSVGKVPTVKAWLDHWHSTADHRPSTSASYRYYIDHYIDPELGKLRLDKLTIDRLEAFYASLRERDLAPTVIRKCHSIIRVALKHAVWRGHIGRNVASLTAAPAGSPKVAATAMSDEDVNAVLAAAEGDRFEARWYLSLVLGLRPAEAIALEWRDVDLDAGTLKVRQQLQHIRKEGLQLIEAAKTESGERTIYLPAHIVELLRKRREMQLQDMAHEGDNWLTWEWKGRPCAFIFTLSNGLPLRPRYDTTEWKKLLARAGLPHTRRYTSRHTAASSMIALGVDVATVSDILGHSTPAFTMSTYVHAIEERKQLSASILEERHAGRKVQNKVQTETGPTS